MGKVISLLGILFAFACPSFASTLRLVMFDGFEENGCKHGLLEEQVIKNFTPGVSFQVTEYGIGHGVNCDQFDSEKLSSLLNSTTQFAKTEHVVVYFGYVIYGRVSTWNKQLTELSKYATIIVGAGNIANDTCTQNWLAPYGVIVGSAKDGAIESYSGRGACTDLYLDYGGSLTVIIDGVYYGVGGTSTSSAIVAARALSLWAANPQVSSAQVNTALTLNQRLLKTSELMMPPGVEISVPHVDHGLVSVAGRAKGPVPAVSVYRGLPAPTGACKGKALATVAVRQDGTFALTVSARGANLCVEPEPLGAAIGVAVQ